MSKIDLESVPTTHIRWPAAYRLRPANLPSQTINQLLGEEFDGLDDLINMCSPVARHEQGVMLLPFPVSSDIPKGVLTAFAYPAPDWQFAPPAVPHMAVADTVRAAIILAGRQYGQFLRDTDQAACQLSFVLERYILSGSFADVTDKEMFASCYDRADYSVPQQLVSDLAGQDVDGLLAASGEDKLAVALNPACFEREAKERAIALEWDGNSFQRYYDYRDMYWASLAS